MDADERRCRKDEVPDPLAGLRDDKGGARRRRLRRWVVFLSICLVFSACKLWLNHWRNAVDGRMLAFREQMRILWPSLIGGTLDEVRTAFGLGEPIFDETRRDWRTVRFDLPFQYRRHFLGVDLQGERVTCFYIHKEPSFIRDFHHEVEGRFVWKFSQAICMGLIYVPLFLFPLVLLFACAAAPFRVALGQVLLGLSLLPPLGTVLDPAYGWRYCLILPALVFEVPMVLLSVTVIAWGVRAQRLADQPLCRECRCNLTGNFSDVCPKCGTTVPSELRSAVENPPVQENRS